jgi:hypothetical protein
MTGLKITMTADTTAVAAFAAELTALVEAADGPAETLARIGDGLLRIVDDAARAFDLEAHAAPGTGKLTIVCEPGKGLRRAMAALRARDLDLCLAEIDRHLSSSSNEGVPASEDGVSRRRESTPSADDGGAS